MLTNCHLTRFKNLSNFQTDLDLVNVLVGGNNSGKSSVLQAIHLSTSIAQSQALITKRLLTTSRSSFTISTEQLLYTPLTDIDSLAPSRHLRQDRASRIEISVTDDVNGTALVGIRRGKNANLAVDVDGLPLLHVLSSLDQPWSIYVPGLAGISRNEAYVEFGLLRRAVARGDANLFLRNVLYRLYLQSDLWKKFVKYLNRIFPGTKVLFPSDKETAASLDVEVSSGGLNLPIEACGTGFLQASMILGYVALFSPALLLLDEPDSHLHPTNQRKLAGLLREIAEETGMQLIIATHSRHILDELREQARILWCRSGEACPFSDEVEILMDLGALDKAEGLRSGAVSTVIFTEDANRRLIEILIESIGKSDEVLVFPFYGCSNINLAHAMADFVRSWAPDVNIIVHRDRDYLLEDDCVHLLDEHRTKGLKLYLTPGVDIEAIFCSSPHIAELNKVSKDDAKNFLQDVLSDQGEELKKAAKVGQEDCNHWRHKTGLGSLSHTEVAEWLDGIDPSAPRWRKGKILLSAMRAEWQKRNGRNLISMAPSDALRSRGKSLQDLIP